MVNALLDERADDFAAHLQRIGELIDPGFLLIKQTITKGDLPLKRLSGDIRLARFLIVRFDYELFLNPETGLLSVNESTFSVIRGAKNSEPLVRWDYIRSPRSNIPCAHIQIHSHRDEWTHALVLGGTHSGRSRRRIKNEARTPHVADIHFTMGRRWFRPCLEEILLLVIDELGVACTPQAREALNQGIEDWEQIQVRSVVRHNRATALEALEE
ncbi:MULTISPECIES: hypothetical protein [Actinotignum]|uniref:Uncharacterized protein n=3 Tax=Actinotignum TaxID=1653174 RepID=A0ABU5GDX8_9ACTO|nr:hypothetical protein [Actinotignum timonense]MDY5134999.1 hypothetical protein [Actinotignum timonense]MDY5146996.1 hypothetical protein [Actinotignum timonense]MDY5155885.1 hypothetical protein [Actinotignum timonense]MDY5158198.1 hypothetical protein [Actinotignum timonense]